MMLRGSHKLQILLDEWETCAGQWKKSTLYSKLSAKTTERSYGARVWLTRAQIAAKYGGGEEGKAIADSICEGKLKDPEIAATHTKWHPDAPGNEAPLEHACIHKTPTMHALLINTCFTALCKHAHAHAACLFVYTPLH